MTGLDCDMVFIIGSRKADIHWTLLLQGGFSFNSRNCNTGKVLQSLLETAQTSDLARRHQNMVYVVPVSVIPKH